MAIVEQEESDQAEHNSMQMLLTPLKRTRNCDRRKRRQHSMNHKCSERGRSVVNPVKHLTLINYNPTIVIYAIFQSVRLKCLGRTLSVDPVTYPQTRILQVYLQLRSSYFDQCHSVWLKGPFRQAAFDNRQLRFHIHRKFTISGETQVYCRLLVWMSLLREAWI